MLNDGNSGAWSNPDDPFREDLYLVPPEEETWARAEQVRQDNRDAMRHYVELLAWETMDNPGLRAIVISLLWHWEDIDPRWLAEGCFMSVGDVRDIAQSQPLMVHHCLDCGEELPSKGRHQLIQRHGRLKALCTGAISDDLLADHLCKACARQRADDAEEQRRLDDLRQQAMLAEYRKRPYAERRGTREWAILKQQVHRRDGHRCRLCGSNEQLHVHHCTYTSYAEERLEDLITLCRSCHSHFHFLSEAS